MEGRAATSNTTLTGCPDVAVGFGAHLEVGTHIGYGTHIGSEADIGQPSGIRTGAVRRGRPEDRSEQFGRGRIRADADRGHHHRDHHSFRANLRHRRTATATSTAAPADQGSSAAGGAVRLPESGPGIDEPGVLLIAVPDATGSFEVTERLRLARPTATLTVAPLDVSRAGAIFRDADVTATDVQVSAGDQPVVVPSTVERALTLAVAGDRFTLRYRLDGVTVRSRPSTAARALAAIGPLSSRLPAELPVVVIVSGPTVLGINCPLRPLAAQSCGIGGAPRWTLAAPLRANAALAMVQFDLPVD